MLTQLLRYGRVEVLEDFTDQYFRILDSTVYDALKAAPTVHELDGSEQFFNAVEVGSPHEVIDNPYAS